MMVILIKLLEKIYLIMENIKQYLVYMIVINMNCK